ncbi:hypothetical protein [Halostreptopolyspora alba]|uniref:hypothetical protein n=1 Tax=Halostreptopolyspora alba TaxID=2487137 RepID=UPI003713BE75
MSAEPARELREGTNAGVVEVHLVADGDRGGDPGWSGPLPSVSRVQHQPIAGTAG